jgi:hypothetical protein
MLYAKAYSYPYLESVAGTPSKTVDKILFQKYHTIAD